MPDIDKGYDSHNVWNMHFLIAFVTSLLLNIFFRQYKFDG